MSTHANPELARTYLDGDGWRGPAGTARPADPFSPTLAAPWGAFGGIETGPTVTPTRSLKELPVWNWQESSYKAVKGPKSKRVKIRCVDNSPATVLTILQGGSIVEEAPNVFRWDEGFDETFALLLQLRDGDERKTHYVERATLVNDPAQEAAGEVLDGYDFEILALSPVKVYTNSNPLDVAPTVPAIASHTPAGTFATAGGQLVALTGAAFTGTTAVTIGGTAAADFEVLSDSTLVFSTPAKTAGAHNVVVTNAEGPSAGYPLTFA